MAVGLPLPAEEVAREAQHLWGHQDAVGLLQPLGSRGEIHQAGHRPEGLAVVHGGNDGLAAFREQPAQTYLFGGQSILLKIRGSGYDQAHVDPGVAQSAHKGCGGVLIGDLGPDSQPSTYPTRPMNSR